MKQASRIALGALGILLFSCSAALAYWTVAPDFIGPKSEIGQVCSLIKPNMSQADIGTVLSQKPAMQITPLHEGERYISQVKEGWMCTCGVTIAGDRVTAVKEVICVD